MRTVASTIVLLVAATGCVRTRVQHTNAAPRPLQPRDPASVAIYTLPPPAHFTEVAVITATGGFDSSHLDEIREAAADTGCDAIVVIDSVPSQTTHGHAVYHASPQPRHGPQAGHGSFHGHTEGYTAAACIVFQ